MANAHPHFYPIDRVSEGGIGKFIDDFQKHIQIWFQFPLRAIENESPGHVQWPPLCAQDTSGGVSDHRILSTAASSSSSGVAMCHPSQERSDWKPRIWWILLTRGRINVSKDTRFIVPPLRAIRLLVEYGRAHHPVISIPRDESLRDSSSSLTWYGPSHL